MCGCAILSEEDTAWEITEQEMDKTRPALDRDSSGTPTETVYVYDQQGLFKDETDPDRTQTRTPTGITGTPRAHDQDTRPKH